MFCSLELLGESRTNVSFHKVYNAPLVDPKKEKNEGGQKINILAHPKVLRRGGGEGDSQTNESPYSSFFAFLLLLYIFINFLWQIFLNLYSIQKKEKNVYFSPGFPFLGRDM